MRLTVEELLDATQIGRLLHRSCKTIRAQRDNARLKMNARSLLHAALMWDRQFRANQVSLTPAEPELQPV
jgi:DNA-binding CsgD family transcriptional regulator